MNNLSIAELSDFLEYNYSKFNSTAFIADDPISIPHRFTSKKDIEISGLFVATIAWGHRKSIIANGVRLMELMDNSPYEFVLNFTTIDLKVFDSFVHRTFNGEDCKYFLKMIQHIYRDKSGLNKMFSDCLNVHNNDIGGAISDFKKLFFCLSHPNRTLKHMADPMRNSSAKRFCMFLRWMVRSDNNGVDFGLWKDISPSVLAIPLDIHSGRVARTLGLLKRNQNDWKAVTELTNNLRKFDPLDPVKYDFALFGLGVNEKFT